MRIPLDTVLMTLVAVPTVIAVARGKDGATRAWGGALLLLAVLVGIRFWVAPVGQLLSGAWLEGTALLIVVLGVIVALRSASPIGSTLLITAASLLALQQVGLVA
jgi:hypothetical protein